jgi:hypothetical protein
MAIKAAGWRGVGFWQASGMWPGDTEMFNSQANNATNINVYCKREIQALWAMVGKYFSPADNLFQSPVGQR